MHVRKVLATSIASILGAGLLTSILPTTPAGAVTPGTLSGDNYRTGWFDNQPTLAPSNINASSFGRVLDVTLNGQIYASPVIYGTTAIAATENNYVYGIDTASGAIKWTKYLGAPVPATTTSCGDLTPNLGVTSTPVVDPSTGHVYVMNKTWDGSTNASIKYEFHAIDIATGNERSGWPAAVGGTSNNVPSATFDAQWQGQRPGLLLLNGAVYAGFGGHCGQGPYRGWVAGFSTSSPVQTTLWSNSNTPSDPKPEGGIWMGGGGLVSDGDGQILLTTGNGPPPPIGAGNSNPNLLGDSVVRLQVQNNGHLQTSDFFSPSNADFLGIQDLDLGSGGIMALPEQYFGTTSYPKLAMQTGKEGITYVLDRTNLGGRSQGPGQSDNVIQKMGPYNGQWGHPAAYGGEGGWVYYTENSNKIRAFSYGVDSSGKPQFTAAGNTVQSWGYTSGSPVITSNGTTTGSAVLWSMYTSGPTGADGKLRAFKAIPNSSGNLEMLYEDSIGTMSKFATPVVDNGRVYIGTRDGHLMVYGSLNSNPILSANSTDFQTVTVGSTKTETVNFIANGTVTVSGFTSSNAAFTVGTPSVSLPVTLHSGDPISVPVTFTPTTTGQVTANLGVTNNVQTLQVGLAGTGQASTALPTASPSTVAFGDVQTSTTATRNVTISNQGGTAFTVNSVTAPSSPFTVTNGIPTGTVLTPGQSISTTINVSPTTTGSLSSSLVYGTTAGTLTVPVTATAVAPGHMTLTPATLDFGDVQVGSNLTKSFVISNTGSGPMTLSLAKAPEGVFTSGIPAVEGDTINAGDTRTITVQFAPNAPRSELGAYILTANDGTGQHAINLVGVGTPSGTSTTSLPNFSNSGWSYYGSGTHTGDVATLTAAGQQYASGTAFYGTAIPSNGLHVAFDAEIGGGGTSGGDGMALVLKDSASTINQGSIGEGLGFAGMPGTAVTLDTYQNGGSSDPSGNFVAVANTSTAGGHLSYAATSTNVSDLRTGTHHVDVIVSNGKVYVSVDGTNVMVATPSTLPTNVKVGFSGGSGGNTDDHKVSNLVITSTTTPGPTGGVALPGFTNTAWQFNNDASYTSATAATLTPNTAFAKGSAVYTTAVQASGLHASFDGYIGGGSGADGMTFTLIDPASTARIGAEGGGLGYSGITGVAVTIDTFKNGGSADPSNNFMSIATSGTGSNLTYAVTSIAVPNLRATHHYDIGVTGGRLLVGVDGLNVFDQAVTLPSTVLPAFTAGNGGSSDIHSVSNVEISTGNTFPASGGSVLPAFSNAGWTYTGGAVTDGSSVTLTTATQQYYATSAFYNQARPSDGIQAAFDTYIGGGGGADGMTFALIDPSQTARTGAIGGGLGYSGLTGVAVTMDTWKNGTTDPSNNFVGIATSGSGSTITYAGTTTSISDLRVGLHHFEISTEAGHLIVKIDGVSALDVAVTLPPNVLIGFTAGTGGNADIHKVSNVLIRTK